MSSHDENLRTFNVVLSCVRIPCTSSSIVEEVSQRLGQKSWHALAALPCPSLSTSILPYATSINETMSDSSKLRAAILIISETAAKDPSTDKGIPALREVIESNGGERWGEITTAIVSDNALDIQRTITQWTDGSDDFFNLVVTSGGTGFTTKDITPEVGRLPSSLVRDDLVTWSYGDQLYTAYCKMSTGFNLGLPYTKSRA